MLSNTSGVAKKRKQKQIEESKVQLPKITSFLKVTNKGINDKIKLEISNNSWGNVRNLNDHLTQSYIEEPPIDKNEPIVVNTKVNLINVGYLRESQSFDLSKPQLPFLENTDMASF